MATLNIASKANQAATLPALLVASYANESDSNASITVKYDEVDTLKSGQGASVELILGNDSPTYDSKKVIEDILVAYPFIQGKHENLVGDSFGAILFIDNKLAHR